MLLGEGFGRWKAVRYRRIRWQSRSEEATHWDAVANRRIVVPHLAYYFAFTVAHVALWVNWCCREDD